MAEKIERDPVTGVRTTGHEWDGIKELDNPMPRWWLWVFYACIIFSVIWWILFPAWPGSSGYTPGILGSNARVTLEERLVEAREAQAVYLEQIAALSPEEISAAPDLLNFAVHGGQRHFNDNCAGCHGLGGGGQLHYPSLADDCMDLGRLARRDSLHDQPWHPKRGRHGCPLLDDAGLWRRRSAVT